MRGEGNTEHGTRNREQGTGNKMKEAVGKVFPEEGNRKQEHKIKSSNDEMTKSSNV